MIDLPPEFAAFRALSARLGQDPLRVQGPGGNTSLKAAGVMWIKASGIELANAETTDIFVAIDRAAAVTEALDQAGDGSCKTTVLDRGVTLRPSIETTFHAVLDWPVVAHTHSIATLAHGVSIQGRAAALEKLADLPFVSVPYAKPGLPLTREILARIKQDTQVIMLESHGLIVCGKTAADTEALMNEVEHRLRLPSHTDDAPLPDAVPPEGFAWAPESWIASDARSAKLAVAGSYYPDHVVFLGPALPAVDHDGHPPAVLVKGIGIALRTGATASQRALLRCLSDLLRHLPETWTPEPIGAAAEAELLDWDAEKYRQALAARS